MAFYSYAEDHDGNYPTGKSSTEVFQKLVDGDYISDPSILCTNELKIKGKTKATSKQLKPENVTWDVTVPVDRNSPDDLPVLFSTGYRIEYVPHGRALPLPNNRIEGIEASFHSMATLFKLSVNNRIDGAVIDLVPGTFVSDGKKYVQLTPAGPLEP